MTLRARVLATLVAALAVIGLLGWQLTVRYTETLDSINRVLDVLSPAAASVADVGSDIDAMERRLRNHVASGADGYRLLYEASTRATEAGIDELDGLLGEQPGFHALLEDFRGSYTGWLAEVGSPAEAAMAARSPEAARELLDSSAAQAAYSRMSADVFRLESFIATERRRNLAETEGAARRLAWMLGAALSVLLLLPVLVYLALQRSVLHPIGRMREQLRAAAADHEAVIQPGGPPEVLDLGRDAEALRRALVHEIDAANAARAALEQEGPVVDAIRRELAARTDAIPPGVVVAGMLRPAEGMLAGDFWDRTPLSDGRTVAVVCDVSGHGPRAGVVAMRLKTALMLGLLAGQDAPQVFHRTCDTFADEPGRFATVLILIADPANGQLRWVNAGHPAARIIRAGGTIERLAPTGPMLSWLGGVWTIGSVRLGPADMCLAFTDGILESRDADGEELGDEELDALLLAAARGTNDPQEVIAHVLAGVRQRADDLGRDDVTLVALRLDPQNTGTIPTPRA